MVATLIGCPDCGGPASAKARACPRCGAPIWKRRPYSVARATFYSLWWIVLAIVGIWRIGLSAWIVVPIAVFLVAGLQLGSWWNRREWYRPPAEQITAADPPPTK